MNQSTFDYLTIVSGLPRSGTSMMMQMLDEGGVAALTDNIRTADEDNPKGYYEFEPVKKTKEDASWLKGSAGKVVKMVHLLLLDLPDTMNYRVVFMRRHLDEVVKSQNIMLDRHQKGTGDLPPEKVKQIFQMQIDKVFQFVRGKKNFRMMEVSYNDVMTDPVPVIDRLNTFLDGRLNVAAMRAVVDPQLYRNRAK